MSRRAWKYSLALATLCWLVILLTVHYWTQIEAVLFAAAYFLIGLAAVRLLGPGRKRRRRHKRGTIKALEDLATAIATMLIARNTLGLKPRREKFPPTTAQPVYKLGKNGPGDFPEDY